MIEEHTVQLEITLSLPDTVARAKLTAPACSAAPEGHARWTVRLLADTLQRHYEHVNLKTNCTEH
jgi:hypothetical protein